MRRNRKIKVYTVVEVWRGIASSARSFANLSDAKNYMREISKHLNQLEDEVRLFENFIKIPSAT